MTIKPVIVSPSQKRVGNNNSNNNDAEKDTQGVPSEQARDPLGPSNVTRAATSLRNAIDSRGMSPQRRVEVFDELARHRCSPHKSTRSKRREHHELSLKRDRTEREKLSNILPTVSTKCGSPHNSGCVSAVTGINNNGNKSPTTVGINAKPTDNISGIPTNHSCPSPKSPSTASGTEDNYSGYNSGDEHQNSKENAISLDEWKRRDEQFAKCMADRGYVLKPVEEDGACLFRAISLQIYGDEGMHDVIRQHTMDYIYKNREYFRHFVTEDINNYIKRKRRVDSHGNHIEIQAMSEIYSRPVEVYCYKPTPINIFNSEQIANGYPPLRLSYQRGSHYNAILDPYNATVGVGLGLAGYQPELQTKEAVRLSEQLEIEQTMFEDKLKTTDWEATNEAIEEQIARESYLQWCRENLQRSRGGTTCTVASVSATITSSEANSNADVSSIKYLDDAITGSICSTGTTMSGNMAINSAENSASTGIVTLTVDKIRAACSKSLEDKVSGTAMGQGKDNNCDGGAESDDTDISSTSSIGNMENVSPSCSGRSRKKKTRVGTASTGKKRRREHTQGENANELKDSTNVRDSKIDDSVSTRPYSASNQNEFYSIVDAEQQPCTSKQLHTPEKSPNKGKSSVASSSTSSSSQQPHISSFYQELLQASLAGFGQLSESEMLQQAIQMSTQDYIEDLKRKY